MIGKAWTPDKIGFVACYPNLARAGSASLGMHVITSIADAHPRFIADTCFLPEKPGVTRLISTQLGAPLTSFSLVGFSCAFEPDYLNVARIMQLARIPSSPEARGQARADGRQIPIIIAGGIAVSSNPLPLLPFLDFIFLFDAETSFAEFLDNFPRFLEESDPGSIESLAAWWDAYAGSRRGIVPAFKYREGIPWPEIFTSEACKLVRPSLDAPFLPRRQSLADPDDASAALGTSYLLEIGRGCGEGCRFCLVGSRQRPPRFASVDAITKHVKALKAARLLYQKVALIATNVADHPDLAAICENVLDAGYQVSIPSTKPLCEASLLDAMQRSGIKTATMAPETGSERLRIAVNKKVTNAEYEATIVTLLDHGISTVKLYLMFGLPGETPADLDATIEFLESVKATVSEHGAKLAISLNPFIPKLGTPLMFHVDNYFPGKVKQFKREHEIYAKRVEKACRTRVDAISVKDAQLQAVLSLGGVDLASYLQHVPLSIPDDIIERVLAGIKAMLDASAFSEPLDRIVPVSLAFLKREWDKALVGESSPRCAPPASCAACGHMACEAGHLR